MADAVAAAAREAGAEIRTGADIAASSSATEPLSGVVLPNGEEIAARAVVSGAGSEADAARTDRSDASRARFRTRRAEHPLAWDTGEDQLRGGVDCRDSPRRAVSAKRQRAALSGRVRLAADIDAIERAFDAAKYGGFAADPWIELTIPSIADPSLAPPGQHVVSAYLQYAPIGSEI